MNRDDIVRMAWKANLPSCHITHPKALERFAALVAAHEREECVKVCDALAVDPKYASQTTKLAAMAIRDRGEK
jgi:lipopolysaccharide biosynthesis protein